MARDPFDSIRIVFAWVVTAAWLASVVASLFAARPIDPWVHLIAAAIATFLFGPGIWRRNGSGSSSSGEPKA